MGPFFLDLWGVTLALLDPLLLVILPVVHHFQDVHLLRLTEHSGDEAKPVVTNVEYDTATLAILDDHLYSQPTMRRSLE